MNATISSTARKAIIAFATIAALFALAWGVAVMTGTARPASASPAEHSASWSSNGATTVVSGFNAATENTQTSIGF